jgi:hypothetical protein
VPLPKPLALNMLTLLLDTEIGPSLLSAADVGAGPICTAWARPAIMNTVKIVVNIILNAFIKLPPLLENSFVKNTHGNRL